MSGGLLIDSQTLILISATLKYCRIFFLYPNKNAIQFELYATVRLTDLKLLMQYNTILHYNKNKAHVIWILIVIILKCS